MKNYWRFFPFLLTKFKRIIYLKNGGFDLIIENNTIESENLRAIL